MRLVVAKVMLNAVEHLKKRQEKILKCKNAIFPNFFRDIFGFLIISHGLAAIYSKANLALKTKIIHIKNDPLWKKAISTQSEKGLTRC